MKISISLASIFTLACLSANAQQPALSKPLVPQVYKAKPWHAPAKAKRAQAAPIWSEDFSNGIPSGWTQNGSPTTAQWEYRGPSTTPDTGTGSRGAFAGTLGTIQSPSAGNGFIIFDSGYLDNGGNPFNLGGGTVPAPHTGVLETDKINLSGHPNVVLRMNSFARNFNSLFLVAVSNDGGVTYPDTFSMVSLGINQTQPNGEVVDADISGTAGNQSDVKLRFIFDGTNGNLSNTFDGYYFWMLDDLEIVPLPNHKLRFHAPQENTRLQTGTVSQPIYGHYYTGLNRGYNGSFAVVNFGDKPQTNVKATLEVFNTATQSRVFMDSTIIAANLPRKDTFFSRIPAWNNAWVPNAPGNYQIVYKITSDSVGTNKPGAAITDSFSIVVSDSIYGLDNGTISNFVGTNSLANGDIIGLAAQYDFKDSTQITGSQVFFSNNTDSLGDIELQIYDTISSLSQGLRNPIKSQLFSLSSNNLGNLSTFIYSTPITLAPGSYYLKINFFPRQGQEIAVANDDSKEQPGLTSLMQDDAGSYFTGFSNSRNFESPFLRLKVKSLNPTCDTYSTLHINICDTITSASGKIFTQPGIVLDTIPNAAGCDSIITYDLIPGPVDSTIFNLSICDTVVSATGRIFTRPGVFIDSLTNKAGCDSLLIYQLTPGPADSISINPQSCGPYTVPSGDTVLSVNTTYVDTLTGQSGCDSLIFINLTIIPDLSVKRIGDTLLAQPQNTAATVIYQWLDCTKGYQPIAGATNRKFTLPDTGSYAVQITRGGCVDTSACVDVNSIDLPENRLQRLAKAYPNPSSGQVTVELGFTAPQLHYELRSVDGKLLSKGLKKGVRAMNLNLPEQKGVYILQLKTKAGEKTQIRLIRK